MSRLLDTVSLFWPAFAASLAVALACALIGVHVAARRLVVVGVALPQVAAFGIALSFVCSGWLVLGDHDFAALTAACVGVALLAWGAPSSRLGHDVVAGILFVASAAGTVLLVQQSAAGLDEIRHLVEGNVLAVHGPDVGELALLLAPVVIVHLVALRRLVLVTLDRETAATLGIRTGLWDGVFYATLALGTAAGVHATGTLFVFGFLVLPGATGLVVGRSTAGVFGAAAASAVLAAGVGFVASCAWDTPTGPTCVATALAVFLAARGADALRRN